MSKFFGYFVSSLFEITLGFLIGLAALLALALVMFWPLLVWDSDNVIILPAIVVNGIVLISLLFAYIDTKDDEGE